MRDWPAEIRARLARSQYEDLPADVVDEISTIWLTFIGRRSFAATP
jgi:hypothetical protein